MIKFSQLFKKGSKVRALLGALVFVLCFAAFGGGAGVLANNLAKKSNSISNTEVSQTSNPDTNNADVQIDEDDGKLHAADVTITVNPNGGSTYKNLIWTPWIGNDVSNRQDGAHNSRISYTASTGTWTQTYEGDDAYTGITASFPITSGKTYRVNADLYNGSTKITSGSSRIFQVFMAPNAGYSEAQSVSFNYSGYKTFTANATSSDAWIRFDNDLGRTLTIKNFWISENTTTTSSYTVTMASGAYYQIPQPGNRGNYTFSGWDPSSGSPSCNSYNVIYGGASGTVRAKQTTTAYYRQVLGTTNSVVGGTSKFGGTTLSASNKSKTVSYDQSITLTASPKDGYYFKGWYYYTSDSISSASLLTSSTSTSITYRYSSGVRYFYARYEEFLVYPQGYTNQKYRAYVESSSNGMGTNGCITLLKYKGTDTALKITATFVNAQSTSTTYTNYAIGFDGSNTYSDKKTSIVSCTSVGSVVFGKDVGLRSSVFSGCTALTTVDFSSASADQHYDDVYGDGASGMFYGCTQLVSVDVPSGFFENGEGSYYDNLFYNCRKLTHVSSGGYGEYDSSSDSEGDYSGMFYNCSSLEELDISSLYIRSGSTVTNMLYNCTALKKIKCPRVYAASAATIASGSNSYYEVNGSTAYTTLSSSNANKTIVRRYTAYYVQTVGTTKSTAGGSSTFAGTALTASNKSRNVYWGESYSLAATANAGYTFTGWYSHTSDAVGSATLLSSNGSYTLQYKIDGNRYFYAKFTANTYTAYFRQLLGATSSTAGGSATFAGTTLTTSNQSKSVTYNSSYALVATPKAGYSFLGWEVSSDDSVSHSSLIGSSGAGNFTLTYNYAGDRYFYAWFIARSYTVTYNPSGGYTATASASKTFNGTYGTLPTPTKTGYTFAGWTLLPAEYQQVEYIVASNGQYINTGIKPTPTTKTSIVMKFNSTTIQQRMFGVYEGDDVSDQLAYESYINGSGYYAFAFKDGAGNWVSSGITVTTTDKFTVDLDGNYRVYAVYLNSNGASKVMSLASYTATRTADYNLFLLKRDLNGSASGTNASANFYGATICNGATIQRNYVPCYRKSDNVVGVYDTVNGTFTASGSGSFTYGGTNPGYLSSSSTVVTPHAHNIYANWTVASYTVTFDKNGGTGGSNSVSATYGSAMPSATMPTIPGYVFDGYYADMYNSQDLYIWYDGLLNNGISSARNVSATTWVDLMGHANATLNGTPTWSSNGYVLSGDDFARTANVSVGAYATYEIRLTIDSSLSSAHIIDHRDAAGSTGTQPMYWNGSGIQIWPDSTYLGSVGKSTYTLTAVFDGTSVKLYVNGVLAGSKTGSNTSSNAFITLGARCSDTNKFIGTMYSFRLYTRALTAAEIASNYEIDQARFASGKGVKYYNTDGTSAKNWDIAFNATLKAHWTKAVLSQTWNTTLGATATDITSITTAVSQASIPNDATDVSATGYEGTVYAKLTSGTLTFYTNASKIYLPANSSHIFSSGIGMSSNIFTNLASITLTGFDTSNVTDMSYMFGACRGLTSLNVTNFDTSGVIDMSYMFGYCSGLTSLNVTNFNTSSVTDMSCMFGGSSGLTSLNLANFNTANVTDMSSMFLMCSNLTTLDVTNFNTSNVTNMSAMFYECINLTNLNFSNFNTSNVTNMFEMFYNCSGLTDLDLSSFNTASISNGDYSGFREMFYGCSALETLNIGSFTVGSSCNVTDMLLGCSSLKKIYCPATYSQSTAATIADGSINFYNTEDSSDTTAYTALSSATNGKTIVRGYTITYNTNGGTQSGNYDSVYLWSTGTAGIGYATKPGHSVTSVTSSVGTISGGLTTDGTLTVPVATAEAITITWTWTANRFALTLNPQGGSVGVTFSDTTTIASSTNNAVIYAEYNSTVLYKASTGHVTVSTITTTKDGYIHLGYYTAASAGTKVINASTAGALISAFTGTTATTYHAQWQALQYTITFNSNNATTYTTAGLTSNSFTASYDTAYKINTYVTAIARNGYTFEGWRISGSDFNSTTAKHGSTNPPASGVTTTTDIPNTDYILNLCSTNGGSVTLTARWSGITYDILYQLNNGTHKYGASGNIGWATSYTTGESQQDKNIGWATRAGYTPAISTNKGTITTGGLTSDGNLRIPANTYGDITITWTWTGIEYDILYQLNNGTHKYGSADTGWALKYTTGESQQTKNVGWATRLGYSVDTVSTSQGTITSNKTSNETLTIPANTYGDITITWTWERNVYQIIYVLNDGTHKYGNANTGWDTSYTFSESSQVVNIGWATRTGYRVNTVTATEGNVSGGTTSNGTLSIQANATEDITVTWTWTPETYTAYYVQVLIAGGIKQKMVSRWGIDIGTSTFDGTTLSATNQNKSVTYANSYTLTYSNMNENVTFSGWYVSESDFAANDYGTLITGSNVASYSLTYNYAGDRYFFAVFTAKTYTATFVQTLNDAKSVAGGTTTLAGTSVTASNQTKNMQYFDSYTLRLTSTNSGYVFMGWYVNATADVPADAVMLENSNVASYTLQYKYQGGYFYAKFASTYTITFAANGGTMTTSGLTNNAFTATYGVPYNISNYITSISLTGYTNKWHVTSGLNTTTGKYSTDNSVWNSLTASTDIDNSDYIKNLNSTVNGAVTLTAQWTANTYTVTFDANGASRFHTSGCQPTTGDIRSFTATYDTVYQISDYVISITNTNSWKILKGFRVTSGLNTETALYSKALSSNPTNPITLTTDLERLWHFKNLTAEPNGTVVLTARWVSTYIVTFDSNGATTFTTDGLDANNKLTASYGDEYQISTYITAISRNGYEFMGWNVTSGLDTSKGKYSTDGSTWSDLTSSIDLLNSYYFKNLSDAADAEVTVTARWSIITYNITYVDNGGTHIYGASGNTGWATTYQIATTIQYKNIGWMSKLGHDVNTITASQGSVTLNKTSDETLTIPANTYGDITITWTWVVSTYQITYVLDGGTHKYGNANTGWDTTYTFSESAQTANIGWAEKLGFVVDSITASVGTITDGVTSNGTLNIPASNTGDITITWTWRANGRITITSTYTNCEDIAMGFVKITDSSSHVWRFMLNRGETYEILGVASGNFTAITSASINHEAKISGNTTHNFSVNGNTVTLTVAVTPKAVIQGGFYDANVALTQQGQNNSQNVIEIFTQAEDMQAPVQTVEQMQKQTTEEFKKTLKTMFVQFQGTKIYA